VSVSSFHGRGFFQPVQSLGDPVAILAAAEAVLVLFIAISFIAISFIAISFIAISFIAISFIAISFIAISFIATFTQRYFGK
jgi:hypothetical protein